MDLEFENQRLEQTIGLAQKQLDRAILSNENKQSEIVSLKEEMNDGAVNSGGDLWSRQNFEDLVALSQMAEPITKKVRELQTVADKIVVLKRMIESPYFARIDFAFASEDENEDSESQEKSSEKIYIGRASLMDEDSYEMHIYDWRSPIASMFYRFGIGSAFYEAPMGKISGELSLKRQYEIKTGILEYFFDADVQIMDEFLRKLLSQNISSKMKTIVETIQKDQDIVIRDMENDVMMVQGVAGSGKTSIALHRAAYLMYQGLSGALTANNIMIISPNTLFEQYISNVLPELGENNVVSMVFEEILMSVLSVEPKRIQTKNQFLERLMTNTKKRDLYKRSLEFKTSSVFLEILNRFVEDIPHNVIDFSDVYYEGNCVIKKEILKEKIISGRKETPLVMKLKQLEELVFDMAKKEWRKKRNHAFAYMEVKKEIQKFTELRVRDLYGKLFQDKEYFCRLAQNLTLPDDFDDIFDFTRRYLYMNPLRYDDAIVLAFLQLKINDVNIYKNIKQVVIDEAQDYYPLQFEIFNLLFPTSKYTILGDINQTLEKPEDVSLYKQIDQILARKKTSLVTMDKSFRCTREILAYSSKFLSQSKEIQSFNRDGEEPKIHTVKGRAAFIDEILAEISYCVEKGYTSIGLICKSERNAISLFDRIKDKINIRLIKSDSNADISGVFILPVYMSKGLEFDAVLLCDAEQENYYSEEDKKLLYIACTRALHRLSLFCRERLNPLL